MAKVKTKTEQQTPDLFFDGSGELWDYVRNWLTAPIDNLFAAWHDAVLDGDDPLKRRVFVDRGGSVLFVAHLDTVQTPAITRYNRKRIHGAGFDDRLGAYLAAMLSRELGADLLLCDLEESGKSTAKHHTCKSYNWIVEFDRASNDVVVYDKYSLEFTGVLEDHWKLGLGSFSDISFLETDVCCFNLGIGYHSAHSKDSYVNLKQCRKQIETFRTFFAKYSGRRFDADPAFSDVWYSRGYDCHESESESYFDRSEGIYIYADPVCDFCGMERGKKIYGYNVCRNCFESMVSEFMYGPANADTSELEIDN